MLGEPCAVGLAWREPVALGVGVAEAGGPERASPEPLAPVLPVSLPVVGDQEGERVGGPAGLGEHLDRVGELRALAL